MGCERGIEVLPGLGLALSLGLALKLGFAVNFSFTLHLGCALGFSFVQRLGCVPDFGNPLRLRFVARLRNTPDLPRVRHRERRVALAELARGGTKRTRSAGD